MERFYSLHVRVCTRCWLVQLPDLVAPESIFSEYAYFSAYSTSWVEHARRYVGHDPRTARARRTRPGRRARLERRLPAPALRRDRRRDPRHRPGRERRGGRRGLRRSDARRVLRPRGGRTPGRRRTSSQPRRRQQRPCAGPGPQRLHRRSRHPARTTRDRDVRVSAAPAPARPDRVRHDLPRALLVLLARIDRGDPARTPPGGVRRRGARDARRLAARIRPARRRRSPEVFDRIRARRRARWTRAFGRPSGTSASHRMWRNRSARSWSF